MLAGRRVTTMLPVLDMARARSFYEGSLGLSAQGGPQPDGKVLYDCQGAILALFPRGAATRAEHTAISFEVDDITREMRDLQARGVRFEEYDYPGLKTVDHVCVLGSEKAAWFKDPEGNLLCIHQRL
jgi:catechol 2,3-dioxygenase-like lactoylglutathione lyase family enzyme